MRHRKQDIAKGFQRPVCSEGAAPNTLTSIQEPVTVVGKPFYISCYETINIGNIYRLEVHVQPEALPHIDVLTLNRKEADALVDAGYETHVVAGQNFTPVTALDRELVARAGWTFRPVPAGAGVTPCETERSCQRSAFTPFISSQRVSGSSPISAAMITAVAITSVRSGTRNTAKLLAT